MSDHGGKRRPNLGMNQRSNVSDDRLTDKKTDGTFHGVSSRRTVRSLTELHTQIAANVYRYSFRQIPH
jgi:hypothetical protein